MGGVAGGGRGAAAGLYAGGLRRPRAAAEGSSARAPLGTRTLAPALAAYNDGRYHEAERLARPLVRAANRGKNATRSPASQAEALRARWVLAFSAARRNELPLARKRFAQLREEAAGVPDPEREMTFEARPTPGPRKPTLEEEAAYHHAVLTGALGDREAAEAEYLAFMRRYPESPLVHAAVRRIAHVHGGDLRRANSPPRHGDTESRRKRKASAAGVEELAREMGTDYQGRTLAALARVAQRHGFAARGLELTWKGLWEQPLPLIALIEPGHYVLVDAVTEDSVLVWSPGARGQGQAVARRYSLKEWEQVWNGIALVLR